MKIMGRSTGPIANFNGQEEWRNVCCAAPDLAPHGGRAPHHNAITPPHHCIVAPPRLPLKLPVAAIPPLSSPTGLFFIGSRAPSSPGRELAFTAKEPSRGACPVSLGRGDEHAEERVRLGLGRRAGRGAHASGAGETTRPGSACVLGRAEVPPLGPGRRNGPGNRPSAGEQTSNQRASPRSSI
ncbi:hypothetical protein Droror1_Dr00015749 [Drosera rotundifolia]